MKIHLLALVLLGVAPLLRATEVRYSWQYPADQLAAIDSFTVYDAFQASAKSPTEAAVFKTTVRRDAQGVLATAAQITLKRPGIHHVSCVAEIRINTTANPDTVVNASAPGAQADHTEALPAPTEGRITIIVAADGTITTDRDIFEFARELAALQPLEASNP